MLRLSQVVAVVVHYLVPGGSEVLHEGFGGIAAGVAFGDGAELGVGAEDKIDAGARPFYVAGGAVAAFEQTRSRCGLPFGLHVEQVDEEIVGQRFRTIGEDAVLGLAEVGVESAEAADENGHFRRGELEQLRAIDK